MRAACLRDLPLGLLHTKLFDEEENLRVQAAVVDGRRRDAGRVMDRIVVTGNESPSARGHRTRGGRRCKLSERFISA